MKREFTKIAKRFGCNLIYLFGSQADTGKRYLEGEAVFDIGRHILAKVSGFKEIEHKTIAKELGKKGVITEELSETLYMMAGYRNRMVHFYKEIAPEELYQIITNHLDDLERFNREIVTFMKEYKKKTGG